MKKNSFKIGIIGLGYVGLPLAVEISKKYNTVGFDINSLRVSQLRKYNDVTQEVTTKELKCASNLQITDNTKDLSDRNFYIITVPTPIKKNNSPDLTAIKNASKLIASNLKKNDIVVYESTVYPGLIEEICVPILEKISRLSINDEFSVGYSPERINPGDKSHRLVNIKKVVSASNNDALDKIDKVYKSIIKAGTHRASSIKVAEAAKVIENTQRDLNIAFVNELSIIFDRLGIDTNEVLDAADTKWNFIKFTPGLVGGHCIGVDPYYLTHKALQVGIKPNIILAGRKTNDQMHNFLIQKIIKFLKGSKTKVKDLNILLLGYTFKENCPDIRNTRVQNLVNSMSSKVSSITIYDPIADIENIKFTNHNVRVIKELPVNLSFFDGLILAVPHSIFLRFFKTKKFLNYFKFILDVKGAIPLSDARIIRL